MLTAIRDSTGAVTGFAKVTRDVTESKQAQEAVIAELSSVLLANVDIRKLLDAISASMKQMVPHDAATLALFDEAAGKLRVQFLAVRRRVQARARARCCWIPMHRRPARPSAPGGR